jgi:CDP-diacylglycerol--glycerol-3-phosphate 3-phosphatidyltransferase
MNLANKLTVLRVLLIPVFIVLILVNNTTMQYLGIVVFLLAALTDSLDGYIARKYNQISDFGKFMDPLADKLLVTAALCALVDKGTMSIWVVYIIILREFVVTGIRLIAVNNGLVIAAGTLGKLKTIVQMVVVTIALLPIDLR